MKPTPPVLAAIAALLLTAAHARTWTSIDGARTFEGELMTYDPDNGMVGVKLLSGKVMNLSLKLLSPGDIAFIKDQGTVDGAVSCTSSPLKIEAVPGSHSRFVRPGTDGKLQYFPSESGDIIPDFSNCGYMGGGVRLPDAAVKITLEPADGDDGARIQAALDEVGKLSPGAGGLRGAVLLKRGNYQIAGSLQFKNSGVVLRGEGVDDKGTVLTASGKIRRDLIRIAGRNGPSEIKNTRRKVLDGRVPVGVRSFRVDKAAEYKVGERIFVIRHGNKNWVSAIGMDKIAPRPGDSERTKQWKPFSISFERKIVRIDGDRITVDAPAVFAIETRWGGGEIAKYNEEGRVRNCGVEKIRVVSEFNASLKRGERFVDEAHASYAITITNSADCWVREVRALHFYHGCVNIGATARNITVQDSRSEAMVSELRGGRRYPFSMDGQLCLVQRCTTDSARHAFVFGARVPGPNVFLDCKSANDHGSSEPHHRWSVGGLYDNVEGNIAIQDRQYLGSGHGWAGANYLAWNCRGNLTCQSPPTAQNWAIGFLGKKGEGAFKGKPDGLWDSLGKPVEPRSLYLAQLRDRLGMGAVAITNEQ